MLDISYGVYPLDLFKGKSLTDYVIFQFQERKRPFSDKNSNSEVDGINSGLTIGKGEDGKSIFGGIEKFGDDSTSDLTAGQFTQRGGFALPFPQSGMKDVINNSFEQEGEGISKELNEYLNKTSFGGKMSRYMGRVFDPKYTQVFKGSKSRSWSFVWTFIPQSESDLAVLINIIYKLKKYSTPKQEADFNKIGLLKEPMFLSVTFSNPLINDAINIGYCCITQVVVDYFSIGNSSTYIGGLPKKIELQLDISELDIKRQSDWEKMGSWVGA